MREPSPYFIHRNVGPEAVAPVEAPFFDQYEEGLDLWKYWQTVRRHLRLIASIFFGALLLTLLRLSMMVPLYTAQATILVAPQGPSIVESRAMSGGGRPEMDSDYYGTQCDILKSRSLAARVIRRQHLQAGGILTGEAGTPSPWTRFWNSLGIGAASTPPPTAVAPAPRSPSDGDPLYAEPWLVDAYEARLKITPIEDTTLVTISFTSTDPRV